MHKHNAGFGRENFSRPFLLFGMAVIFFLANGCDAMPSLKLIKEFDGQTLRLAFSVTGEQNRHLTYEQSVRHTSRAGSSNSVQSGWVSWGEDSSGLTAWATFRNHPSSHYHITVKLFDNRQLVAEHTIDLDNKDLQ